MAQFHCDISVAGRTHGASSVACAAYISRSRMLDQRTGATYDYTRCHRHERLVADLGVTLPEGAPERWRDRSCLWNEVERTERGARSQLCRRVEVALPVELDGAQRVGLAREIVSYYAGQGMVVDACVHDALDGHNPHLHMQMPLRACGPDGFLPKSVNEYLVRDGHGNEAWMGAAELRAANSEDGASWQKVHRWRRGNERRELTDDEAASWEGAKRASKAPVQRTRYLTGWNDRSKAEEWRAAMSAMENAALERTGSSARVDHRSYARRGVERIPTVHEGPAVCMAERRARERAEREHVPYEPVTERRRENERVRRLNALVREAILRLAGRMRRLVAERDRQRARQMGRQGARAAPQRQRQTGRRLPRRGGRQPGM